METITTPTSLYISYEVSSTNDQKNSLVLSVFRIFDLMHTKTAQPFSTLISDEPDIHV